MYTTPSPEGLEFPEPNKRAGSLHCISIYMHTFYETALFKTMEKHCNYRITCNTYIYIYIYTLGAGGSPKVLWVGFCEWLKIVISLWRNVIFEEVILYIELCSARTKFFWSACWLIKNPSFIHLYLWETCDLCGKMTILEMLWCSKCSKVLWATVFLEVVS